MRTIKQVRLIRFTSISLGLLVPFYYRIFFYSVPGKARLIEIGTDGYKLHIATLVFEIFDKYDFLLRKYLEKKQP